MNDPDYGKHFSESLSIIEKAETQGNRPEKLAKVICRIVEKKNPPFRTLTGPVEQVLFARCKRWLPDDWVQFVLRIFYNISGKEEFILSRI